MGPTKTPEMTSLLLPVGIYRCSKNGRKCHIRWLCLKIIEAVLWFAWTPGGGLTTPDTYCTNVENVLDFNILMGVIISVLTLEVVLVAGGVNTSNL